MTKAEFKALKVGDLVESPGGTVRVVRYFSGWYAGFAIRHCSWTRRCYTLRNAADMRGYRVLSIKPRKLTAKIDREIARAIAQSHLPPALTCCDVEGIP